MKELVIISGKGGTGKTSVVASFAALAGRAVFADCDVDAADLHLILDPSIPKVEEFRAGRVAEIRTDDCILLCGTCSTNCRFEAVVRRRDRGGRDRFTIDPFACEGCGVCVHFCPVQAIDFPQPLAGYCYQSETRFGPMVHAKLGIGEENSGKLVSLVRKRAREIAETRKLDIVIIDGSPGIGCPVIASMTGASLVLAITEPTLSGRHDLDRVLDLAEHFNVPVIAVVNKADLNSEMAADIESSCRARGVQVADRIPYDTSVTRAQLSAMSVVEMADSGPATDAIGAVWKRVEAELEGE